MADLKISQLTSATLPLAGTEVLPIVQSSSTKKVATDDLTVKNVRSNATTGILQIAGPATAATRIMTVPDANFTAARTDAAQSFTGDQTLGTGNLIQGTAAKGINFTANTPAAGMTSQLLNWYEEGTWTPTYAFWTIDPTNVYARYTRVGRLVTLNFVAQDGVSVAGNSTIGGLPFTSSNVNGASVAMKDIVGSSPGITAFGAIVTNSTSIGSMTSATFTGTFWAFSTTYMV
jgi:hypothetical protein